ncbi:MAG: efflux RND transporter periplasmic adaptor subunit [Gammaproteobacteria bacterium]|nr:efflux RND transporter periplasmic adaptor subunit [Gammaproteobacteria bacterium]
MNKYSIILLIMSFMIAGNVTARDYDGFLLWPDKQVLAFPVTGVVDQVLVQAGQKVKKGSKLAHLDKQPFSIRIKQVKARLSRIKPLLFDSQRDFDQAQELFERTVLSEVELRKIESVLKGLKADHDSAQAELALANWQYARAQLEAPVDGRITDVLMHAGDIVSDENMSRLMIVMVVDNLMQAAFMVNADAAGMYHIGQDARIEVASERYPAIVKSIVSAEHQQYQVRLEFQLPDSHSYVAGQKARVIF